jgi:hypothetical protein
MIPFMVNSINAILVWHLSNIDMNLTHRQLTMFRAIMLHGNLGRAADACASSQPTWGRLRKRKKSYAKLDVERAIKETLFAAAETPLAYSQLHA